MHVTVSLNAIVLILNYFGDKSFWAIGWTTADNQTVKNQEKIHLN